MTRVRKPTQVDIARAAGVSPAVVSLVINGRADGKIRISESTQERVWEAVRRLNYVPNLAARKLAGGRNQVLGVFTFEATFPLDQSNYYFPFLMGIERKAEELGYDLMLFTRTSSSTGVRSIYRDGSNALQIADGSILMGGFENREEIARLKSDGYPFVYVGRRELNGEELMYVGADYTHATRDMVELVLEAGHRELCYFGGEQLHESAADRIRGFHMGCRDAGILDSERYSVPSSQVTEEMFETALLRNATAFFCERVADAFEIINFGKKRGLEVPRDFSVCALGNTGDSVLDVPWLTNYIVPRVEMGAGAVALLHELLAGEVGKPQQKLPCLIQRGLTVGPAPTGAS